MRKAPTWLEHLNVWKERPVLIQGSPFLPPGSAYIFEYTALQLIPGSAPILPDNALVFS